MTIAKLLEKYTKGELTSQVGEQKLRFEAFSPLFNNLYDNKVIYHERITSLLRLENIIITDEGFNAIAKRIKLLVEPTNNVQRIIASKSSWTVGASWGWLCLDESGYLKTYSGWKIWADPELVKKVEELANNNNFEEALNLTINRKRI